MAKGYQKTMICSDNEYVDYIADFIIKQQQDKIYTPAGSKESAGV